MTTRTARGNASFWSILLLAAVLPLHAQSSWAPMGIKPSAFVRVEALSGGIGMTTAGPYLKGSLLSFEGEWRRFRLGVSAVSMFDLGLSPFPVSLGYTLWQKNHNYAGRLFTRNPEVYVRFTADWEMFEIDEDWTASTGTLDMNFASDLPGLGFEASAGVMGVRARNSPSSPISYGVAPYIGVRVNLLTFAAGF